MNDWQRSVSLWLMPFPWLSDYMVLSLVAAIIGLLALIQTLGR